MTSPLSPAASARRFLRALILSIGCMVLAGLQSPASSASVNAAPSLAQELRNTPIFEEPLVPTVATALEEDRALLDAIAIYRKQSVPDDFTVFEAFLERYPKSGWRVALFTNLGLANYHYGYFSRAIESWESAWQEGRKVSDAEAKPLVDRALGELMRMHARLGHSDRLAVLVTEIGDRSVTGQATEAVTGAKEGLWQMQNNPGVAYLCGPKALKNLMLSQSKTFEQTAFLDSYRSGPNGVSLAEVAALAKKGGQSYTLGFREKDAPIPLPALVHWKVSHFAAIVAEENGRYHVKDPTFGVDLWVTRGALEAESSGYFLLPVKELAPGFRPVSLAEAKQIRGRGFTGNNDPNATTAGDNKGKPCTPAGGCAGAPPNPGMVGVNFHSMVLSLNLTDTPLGYQPPKGPAVFFTLTYNQREATQPATFNFSNVGQKWTTNWLSYIRDDPASATATVQHYVASGGAYDYQYDSGTGTFKPGARAAEKLTRMAGTPVTYKRELSDGTVEIYGFPDGATTFPRRTFLTQIIDPKGNGVTLGYDTQRRLVSITDALGQVTTLGYNVVGKPLLITNITDPFGRSAQLGYDTAGRLQQITDAVGLISQVAYDTGGLVNALTTPYGTTSFAFGGSGASRWLEITDPLGQKELAEFRHSAPGLPDSEPSVPTGINPFNLYIHSRNTFYWDKALYPVTHSDYTKAEIKHWLHTSDVNVTSGVLESTKNPLESRVWYNYPGQQPDYLFVGTLDKPRSIGRFRDDGSTQLTTKTYNSLGNLLTVNDPVGNQTLYDYAPNGIDVIRVRQKSGPSTYMTLAEYTYNTLHKPLTHTDANGQVTTLTYNAAGQLLTRTDSLGRVTTYNYNTNGYLTTVIDANGNTETTLTYDAAGRIATRTDAGGNTLAYQYDNLNRLKRITWPDTTYFEYQYNKLDIGSTTDRLGRVTQYTYDANRNLKTVTDPAGHVTTYTYYPNDKLKTRTDANGGVTQWGRDIQGRVTSVTDPKGAVTSYVYDTTGNIKTVISPDAGTAQLTYNAADRLTKKVDGRGITTNYAYDWMSRLTNVSYPASPLENVTYTYDFNYYDNYENNQLTYLEDNDGYTLFARDAVGNIVAKANWLNSGSAALEYTYDNTDRITKITYPSGRIVLYTRNALGQITQVQTKDDASSPAYTLASEIAYKPFGPVRRVKFGNTVLTTYDRDAEYRPTRIQTLSMPISVRDYSYDAAGNVTTIADPFGTWDRAYTYDTIDRLTSDANTSMAGAFQYDANNNRTNATLAGTPLTQGYGGSSNRLTSWSGVPVTTDGAGNVTGGGISPVTYTYNHANRLSQSHLGGVATNYLYDGFGLRTTKQGTDTIHYDYLLDGKYADAIKMNANGTYNQVTEYIWAGDLPIAQIKTSYTAAGAVSSRVVTYIHADHLNTPRMMTDAAKKVVWRWEGDAFGFVNPDEDPDGNGVYQSLDLGFPGQLADRDETGLFYNINRYYDPATARYTQSDPIGLDGGVNPYNYGESNPIRHIDPFGLNPFAGAATGAEIGLVGGPVGGVVGGVIGFGLGWWAADAAWDALNDEGKDEELQDKAARCRETCSKILEENPHRPGGWYTGDSYTMRFHKCFNECMEKDENCK